MPSEGIGFGRPEEHHRFVERHSHFFSQAQPRLDGVLRKVFERPFAPGAQHPVIVFLLDHLIVEDFMEILLLSGNGYGNAALRILRGMFERVVHARYLSRHPEELQAFLDYDYVHQMRGLRHGMPLPDDRRARVEQEYARVRGQFLDSKGKERRSWTRKNVRDMAGEVGLGELYLVNSYWPTLHAHTTVTTIKSRLQQADGKVTLIRGPQRAEADVALVGAHMLVVFMLEDHARHFGLGLGEDIAMLQTDFKACWNREPPGD